MSGSVADVVPTQEVFPQPQIRRVLSRENENGTLTLRSSAAADLANGYLTDTQFPKAVTPHQGLASCYAALRRRVSSLGRQIRSPTPQRRLRPVPLRLREPSCEPIRWLLHRIRMQENSAQFEGFPRGSKVVTRMFHPAGILMRRNCRRSMTCLIQTDLVRHRGLIIPGLSLNKSNADSVSSTTASTCSSAV